MAIGKISGPMLQTNLERQGVDLSVDTNVAYFDVTNRRLGVNNSSPTQTLDVEGNVRLGHISILGNTITSDTGKINLGSVANLTITGGTQNYVMSTDGAGNLIWAQISDLDISFGNLSFNDTTVQVTKLNANLKLAANGIGVIDANGAVVSNAGYPVVSTDLATKGYIDTTLSNFNDDRIVSGNTTLIATSSNLVSTINGTVKAFTNNSTSQFDNVQITSSTVNSVSGNLHIGGVNRVVVDGTTSITLPVGDTSERPGDAVRGDMRYNTSLSTVEFYDGTTWFGTTVQISSQIIEPTGSTDTFTLTHSSNSFGVLVSINGTLQQPLTAYTVSGTTITFAETPLVTDIIEIRYIALSTIPSINNNTIDSATSNVSVGQNTVDRFSKTTYRSAKYTIQISSASDYQFDDLLVVHNGTTANVVTTSSKTGSNLGIFTASVVSGNVELLFTATTGSTLRVQKTYFLV